MRLFVKKECNLGYQAPLVKVHQIQIKSTLLQNSGNIDGMNPGDVDPWGGWEDDND